MKKIFLLSILFSNSLIFAPKISRIRLKRNELVELPKYEVKERITIEIGPEFRPCEDKEDFLNPEEAEFVKKMYSEYVKFNKGKEDLMHYALICLMAKTLNGAGLKS